MKRRGLITRFGILLALILSLALAGCGGSEGEESAEQPAADTTAEQTDGGNGMPDLSGVTISYLGFGGYLDEQFKEVWMDPFSEETGAEFVLDSPTDYAKIQAQVESGNVSIDVADADLYLAGPRCGELFETVDVSQDGIQEAFRDDGECSVPAYVYVMGMYRNNQTYPDGGPQDCHDFFDVENFPGRRAVWTHVVAAGVIECAAIANGADPTNPYPIDIDEAFATIESIRDSIVTFDSSGQAVDGMVNGDADIYMATTRNFVDAVTKGADFSMVPFLGAGSNTFVIPKGAPNSEAAEAWLSYIMQPEVNQRLAPAAPPYSGTAGGDSSGWPESAKAVDINSDENADALFTHNHQWWSENEREVVNRYLSLLSG